MIKIKTVQGAKVALTAAQKRKGAPLLPQEAAEICGVELHNKLRAELGLQPLFTLEGMNGHNRSAVQKSLGSTWRPIQPR